MTLTKKDYITIAKLLQRHEPRKNWLNKYQQYVYDCNSIADYLQHNRAQFDRKRFLKACGIDTEQHICPTCEYNEIDTSNIKASNEDMCPACYADYLTFRK